MILKLKRTPGLYLVGFMASGKTTVGKALAYELGWSFADIDEDIEASQGMKIIEIFEKKGEEEFRKVETQMIQKRVRTVQSGRPLVAALGGGAFAQQANFELVQENGVTVWLDAPLALVKSRIQTDASERPLARDPEKFEHLYFARRAGYQRADHRVEVSGAHDPAGIVSAILRLPIF
jgi:shikimate kinase